MLAVVRDGLVTAAARYPRGELAATVIQRTETTHCDFDVHSFIWDRGRYYWKYSGKAVYHLPGQTEQEESFSGVELIRDGQTRCVYNPTLGFATRHENALVSGIDSMQDALVLEPIRCWYSFERGKRTWDWMLDPDADSRNLSRFTVRREPSGLVTVERDLKSGGQLQIEFSMEQGGNIVAYYAEAESDRFIRKGSYEWVEHEPGQWRLLRTLQQRFDRSDADTPVRTYELKIKAFDPQPRIPSNRFDFTSLSLAEGTRVSFLNARGETEQWWTVGQNGKRGSPLRRPDQKTLDNLAEKLRKQGFAAPGRSR